MQTLGDTLLLGAVTHTTVNGFFPWYITLGFLVSGGSSGYTRKAISQGKTNVTQLVCHLARMTLRLRVAVKRSLALLPRASKHPSFDVFMDI